MTMWTRMCLAAIRRHETAWVMCGSHPATWPWHIATIVMVYGTPTYEEALLERRGVRVRTE